MRIGGLLKFSMIDFPGMISAIVFTKGCNLRCAYCHNPELIAFDSENAISAYNDEDILDYLSKRKNALDGVVITGGEPTMQPDLEDFISKIKDIGYLVKLDTNGTNPEVVRNLVEKRLVDFIAMDIKAPYEKYSQVCGVEVDTEKIKRTREIIEKSGVKYEFRTTYYKTALNDEDIKNIEQTVPPGHFKVQECLPVKEAKPVLKVVQAQ